VLVGLKRKRVMSPREREIVAAHEAGHAVVASVLPGVDPVHKMLDAEKRTQLATLKRSPKRPTDRRSFARTAASGEARRSR
jgi:cell division protease FtsH